MELTPAQKEVAQDDTRFRVVCAGRRWGKTYLSIEEMIGKAVAADDRVIAYLAPTYKQAREIAWQHLKDRVEPIAKKSNERRLEVIVNTQEGGTSKIKLSSWGKVEGLRGQKFDFLVIDEVAMMDSFWVGWQEIVRPTLTDTEGGAMFISTPKGFNHFYDLYNKQTENNEYTSFHFTTFDNPHIDKEELERAEKDLDSQKFAQEYRADFRKQEGLVYQEFDRQTHVVGDERLEQENFIKEFCGIDWGYRNPSVVLTVKMNKKEEYFITNEWYKTEKTDAEVIEYAMSYDYNAYFPDPENASAIAEMQERGANVREVDKSRRNRDRGLRGIDNVKDKLKETKLYVHESCVNTIEEFESYEYEESKADRNDDERPKKENDHCFAPETEVYTLEGKQKIKDLEGQSGYLFSKYGTVQKYHSCRKTRTDAEVVNIRLSDSETLTVTPDHLVLLESGVWAEARTLKVGEKIQTFNYGSRNHRRHNKTLQRLQLPEKSERLLQSQCKFGEYVGLSSSRGVETAQRHNTGRSHNPPQRWRQGEQQYRQFRVHDAERTHAGTCKRGTKEEESRKPQRECFAGSLQVARIRRGQKVAFATWQENVGEQRNDNKGLQSLSRRLRNVLSEQGEILFRQMQAESPTKKIEGITRGRREVTYNLEVENTQSLIADGVVAHNSMDAIRYILMTHSPTTRNDAVMQRIVQQNRGRNQSFK